MATGQAKNRRAEVYFMHVCRKLVFDPTYSFLNLAMLDPNLVYISLFGALWTSFGS
jgi:hypothetical protein